MNGSFSAFPWNVKLIIYVWPPWWDVVSNVMFCLFLRKEDRGSNQISSKYDYVIVGTESCLHNIRTHILQGHCRLGSLADVSPFHFTRHHLPVLTFQDSMLNIAFMENPFPQPAHDTHSFEVLWTYYSKCCFNLLEFQEFDENVSCLDSISWLCYLGYSPLFGTHQKPVSLWQRKVNEHSSQPRSWLLILSPKKNATKLVWCSWPD